MKKTIVACVIFVLSIIVCVVSISYLVIPKKEVSDVVETMATLGYEKTKIAKTETEDYYYYSVEDFERNLTYSWKFAKDPTKHLKIEDSLRIDEDLRLSIDAKTKDTQTIEERVDQNKLIVTFDYHGSLPLETTVRINVSSKFKNGERLYLYYYNPELDEIEYIEHNVEVKNGFVEFHIDHCSDYFLTAAVVNDAVNNPQSVNYIIIGLVIVVFVLIAVTLKQSGKK